MAAACVAAVLCLVQLPVSATTVDDSGSSAGATSRAEPAHMPTQTRLRRAYQWPAGSVDGGGSVSWRARDRPASTYRHATGWWGAASTKIIIKGPHAPHVYRFRLRAPDRVTLSKNRFGEVVAKRHGRVVGMLGRPWAHDAASHRLRTSFTVHGHVVKQRIRFGRHAHFPLRADPWWNPISWDWGEVFDVTWDGVESCGDGAVQNILELTGAAGTTNILLKHVAGRAAIMVPGGQWGYAGYAAWGCLGSFFD